MTTRLGNLSLRGRTPPLLLLALIFGLGCRSVPPSFTAQIVNQSGKPVQVEYAGQVNGRERERVSVQLAPGGKFERDLSGPDIRAGAKVSGGEMPYGPIEFGFTFQWPRFVVQDDGAGVKVDRQHQEPNSGGPQ